MAIDFMVLPLSRYLVGDYITPVMRMAWSQGVPYTITTEEGTRVLPPDVPFGGPDAPARRHAVQDMLAEDLAALPDVISQTVWDETSDAEPCFHRVDPESYRCLAEAIIERGPDSDEAAVVASLFVPQSFSGWVSIDTPLEVRLASAPYALERLVGASWPLGSEAAVRTLSDALADVVRLQLPMVVDA